MVCFHLIVKSSLSLSKGSYKSKVEACHQVVKPPFSFKGFLLVFVIFSRVITIILRGLAAKITIISLTTKIFRKFWQVLTFRSP